MDKLLLTVKDLMELTGLSKNNAYAEFHKAGAPVVLIGKTRYMNREKYIEWLNERSAKEVR